MRCETCSENEILFLDQNTLIPRPRNIVQFLLAVRIIKSETPLGAGDSNAIELLSWRREDKNIFTDLMFFRIFESLSHRP